MVPVPTVPASTWYRSKLATSKYRSIGYAALRQLTDEYRCCLLGDHGGQLEIPREIDRHAGACPAGSQLGRSWPLQLYRPKNQRETSQTPATYTRYQDRNERVLGAANARMADTFCVPGD